MPPLARTTVFPRPTATPSRGAMLFSSVRNLWEYAKGEAVFGSGGRYTS